MSMIERDAPRALVAEALGRMPETGELEAIIQACRDYFHAWYTADSARMAGCLHPDLAKRKVACNGDGQSWTLRTLDAPTMIEATRARRGTNEASEGDRWIHVAVRDVYGRMASATVVSYPYVEHVHLAKLDDRWRIVNAIWEFREGYLPPATIRGAGV